MRNFTLILVKKQPPFFQKYSTTLKYHFIMTSQQITRNWIDFDATFFVKNIKVGKKIIHVKSQQTDFLDPF